MSNEMKTYIMVHHTPLLIPNWKQLCLPGKYNFILITNQACFSVMTKLEIGLFDVIHLTDDFSYENLKLIFIQHILPKYPGSKEIVTNEEYALIPCAKLREHFNISGNSVEQVLPFRNKIVMKQKLSNLDCLPKYCSFDRARFIKNKFEYIENVIQQLDLPIFVKPIADAGSNNTAKLHNKAELLDWSEKNLHNQEEFELDEFIDGDAYQCDALIKDNQILHLQISKYLYPNFHFLNGKTLGSIPLTKECYEYTRLEEFGRKIIKEFLFVPNGAIHLEFFKTSSDRLVFLEIAARPPGAFATDVYRKQFNIDYKTTHYQLQMGLNVDLKLKRGPYYAYAWFPKTSGKVLFINEPKHFNSKYDFKTRVKQGDLLRKANRLGDFAATVFFWNDDYHQLYQDFKSLAEFIAISIEA